MAVWGHGGLGGFLRVPLRPARITLSLVLARPEGQQDRGRLAPRGEPFGRQAGIDERVQQVGQWPVRGADLVADSLIGPGRLGPVAVEIAGADHQRTWVGTVGEAAAEAWVDADVHEQSAGVQDPGRLAQPRWVR